MGGKTGIKNGKNIERSECSYASAQFCDASSGRWDGYFKHQNLLGHESIDTTLIYLQIAQLSTQNSFSPLDTLFFRIWEEMRGFKTIKKQPTQPQSQPQPQYEVADVLNKLGSKLEDLGLNSWQLRTLFALKSAEHRLWEDISMLATNAEISASATTPAETVIARNAKDGTEKIGYKHGKPNCFLCLIFT